ncbi:acetylglucosamine transferase [Piscinibacter sakaiensis]|uniref:O-linked N-acetylglucosamine transferase, SPINDLY family protein n=1 Tax=Piscinibacter sakaiensis TaxID=1547922 RepID=UPI003AB01054
MSSIEEFGSVVLQGWQGTLSFTELLERAGQLEADGLPQLSVVLYQTWLGRNQSPYAHAGYFNLGAALSNVGDLAAAEASYRQAISLAPGFVHPRLNLGLLLERAGKLDEAIAEWRWIDANSPRDAANRAVVVSALNNLGRVLETRKQLSDATDCLSRSLALQADQPDVLHHWVFLRARQCMWPVYQEIPGVSREAMVSATSALAMIALDDDPAEQLAAARRYVDKKLARNLERLAPSGGYGHERIRIGYLSSDFCLHPVSMLTAQLFELHDRGRFEVYGFCWSPEDGSAMRERVKAGMDRFLRIDGLDDRQAAELIRSHEIDILVDLQGQTSGARANILGHRPAPMQITYLGLPATTGLPEIDHVIADPFLIPPEQAHHYSERPLYMPQVYQVSDRQRVAGVTPTRAECGLPETGFVFCSFNNSFKYTPEVFAVWMKLLQRVPGSVLWLLADNPWSESNLRREAEAAGVSADRLVFAGRVAPENYLARFELADLFLDTFPFNAGTTANDCLWMGCPILTLTGRSFASRMAGALLTAAGLPELITTTLADYEEAAVAIATDPQRCIRLRQHLARERESGPLFDTPQFVRDLEQRLIALLDETALPVAA